MTDIPIVCTLTPDEQRAQRDDLLPGLVKHAVESVELTNGFRFRFDYTADILARICGVVERERQCCRFLRFQVSLDPNLGPVTLDVSGPADSKAFLAESLAARPGKP